MCFVVAMIASACHWQGGTNHVHQRLHCKHPDVCHHRKKAQCSTMCRSSRACRRTGTHYLSYFWTSGSHLASVLLMRPTVSAST